MKKRANNYNRHGIKIKLIVLEKSTDLAIVLLIFNNYEKITGDKNSEANSQ